MVCGIYLKGVFWLCMAAQMAKLAVYCFAWMTLLSISPCLSAVAPGASPCESSPCDPNANCADMADSIAGTNYTCTCGFGFSGNGTHCSGGCIEVFIIVIVII